MGGELSSRASRDYSVIMGLDERMIDCTRGGERAEWSRFARPLSVWRREETMKNRVKGGAKGLKKKRVMGKAKVK